MLENYNGRLLKKYGKYNNFIIIDDFFNYNIGNTKLLNWAATINYYN